MVGPLLLIFIGGVILLQNLGYLPSNFWTNLWRLWPVLLVLAGIELLLAHHIPRLALIGLAALVLVLGGMATNSSFPVRFGSHGPSGSIPSAVVTQSNQTDLGNATQAAVTVRFGAGTLNIGPLAQPADKQLAVMTYTGPAESAPDRSYTANGGTGQLEYELTGHGAGFIPFVGGGTESRMDLNLSPTVPITTLTVQTGATDARLDLSTLRVANIELNVGAASAWIRLPEAAGITTAHIAGGASTVTLEVPPGVSAQIRHRGGLSTVTIDPNRFPSASEGLYRSADYATATNKVDINIETGVTSIQVT